MNIQNQHAADYLRRARDETRIGNLDAAIIACTKVTVLEPAPDPAYIADAYLERGEAYVTKGDYANAIDDFTQVIARCEYPSIAYYFRGLAQLHLRNWVKARGDLKAGILLRRDLIGAFRHRYGSVEEFELKYRFHLPKDIAAMLDLN